MATPQLSPGIIVREVDLTVGRSENILDNIGAIAGPFSIGPVEEVINISSEQELISTFGKPLSTDFHYEYWMSASSYLSYGGILKVVRADDTELKNARVGFNTDATFKIKNFDDYNTKPSGEYHFAAKTPGTWANGLKVCMIDNKADQIIEVSAIPSTVDVGFAVTTSIDTTIATSVGSTESFTGYLKGIITGINTTTNAVDVKVVSRVSSGGTETQIEYSGGTEYSSIINSSDISFVGEDGASVGVATVSSAKDWYDEQTLTLANTTLYWKSIAPKPITTQYAASRNCKNDAFNLVVIDDDGSLTGVQGNILEKHISLSKATDAVSGVNSPQKIWYKNYLANFSNYLYSGTNYYTEEDTTNNISPVVTGFTTYSGGTDSFTPRQLSNGGWNSLALNSTFNAIGNISFVLEGGHDYGQDNGAKANLGSLTAAYDLFANPDDVEIDYLICGPGLDNEAESQAKANALISIAENRKDCLAVISPYRDAVVDITNSTTQTERILKFFGSGFGIVSSSSYAVLDSGYKYTYDRFNNLFRYIPCNADIAGLMSRTNITSYPWTSPAGQQRGILNNAIKLAYSPNKSQRDLLYKSRINPVITQPGTGIVLFGDKTALSYESAFDRINVRRLFLTVEQALQRAANAQLFELNNQATRANFINIVEPYLRDIQSKGGIYDFVVICDDSNNTPDVIDNNEFRADIFLKPTRTINYITLTFVATRTGVSFEEVAGRV